MTAEEIDTIEAGRELDALVAKLAFNRWTYKENGPEWLEVEMISPQEENGNTWVESISRPLPHYSTTWDGAGLVIDHLHRQGWVLKMYLTQDDYWINECIVTKPEWRDDLGIYARDKSLFVAVCRAALKAVLQLTAP